MSTALHLQDRRAALAAEEPKTMAVGLSRAADQFAARLEAQRQFFEAVVANLEKGVDYGELPGSDDELSRKKTDKPRYMLLKPGADRICAAMGLHPRFTIMEQAIEHDRNTPYTKRKKVWSDGPNGRRRYDWKEESGISQGFYRFVVRCELVSHETGLVVGEDTAVCSTLEAKYVDRPRESENTVLQIAQKRAESAAVLRATGLAGRFAGEGEPLDDEERSSADADGVVTDPSDGLTLAVALDYKLNQVPLGTMRPKALANARKWCDGKLAENARDQRLQRISAMLDMVMKHREANPLPPKATDQPVTDAASPAPAEAAAAPASPAPSPDDDGDDLDLPF